MEVIELSQRLDLIEKVVQYFWKCWGNESNFSFYNDCIQNSINPENDLPKFYIVLENQEIIASYTLLINDIISRQDLMPWFACLYVNKSHRNQGIAEQLLNHALEEAKTKGFSTVYLSSDLENFYERKGWEMFGEGFNIFGDSFPIFRKSTI